MLEAHRSDSSNVWRVRIPFISTSFADNLWYYALAWPLWWVLGIEQIILPIFIGFEFIRLLFHSNWRIRLNAPALIAILLAVWWVIPIFWLNREFLDLFLKETATVWAQAFLLILFWNSIRTREEWNMVIRSLVTMATYSAIAGAIFLSGIWQGSVTSLLGRVLPQSLIESSSFFSSIAIREFGSLPNQIGLVPQRLTAFSISFSSLSMVCLILIPIIYWRLQISRGLIRLGYLAVLCSLILSLIFTESRISLLAFVAGVAFYIVLRLGLFRGYNRPISLALALFVAAVTLVASYIALETIIQSFQSAFIDLRPGSWLVRLNIYVVTLKLLPDHLIAGWGVPVRIPGAPSDYSAGTHSSYLGVLFQHGIVGLGLYLTLWFTIWNRVVRGLRVYNIPRDGRLFWVAVATAFFAFNIREIADSWWWDQSLTFVVWLAWGAAITAGRRFTEAIQ